MAVRAIIHYTRCEPCRWGEHYDPPQIHDWAGPDDLEHDPSVAGQPCACACGAVRESHVDWITDDEPQPRGGE